MYKSFLARLERTVSHSLAQKLGTLECSEPTIFLNCSRECLYCQGTFRDPDQIISNMPQYMGPKNFVGGNLNLAHNGALDTWDLPRSPDNVTLGGKKCLRVIEWAMASER